MAPPTCPPIEMPLMEKVSTRLRSNVVPMPVLNTLTPRRCNPTAAPAINPNTAPDAPPVSAAPPTNSTPSDPASRLAKYIAVNLTAPSARSSSAPSWNSSSMFIAMWKRPKWMKPEVTRRYHWCAGMGVPSRSPTRPWRMALLSPRSACA